MNLFVNNFHDYAFVEIERFWKKFMQEIEEKGDLEGIMESHEAFLEQLCQKMFLNEENGNGFGNIREGFGNYRIVLWISQGIIASFQRTFGKNLGDCELFGDQIDYLIRI
ncbi:hypothetical protein IMG5_102990 [Ichthyophthirius multifiliis]|uniref:Gamma tubulin complex component C-terminal domain-containing protein n=1 Tax=Ichthyophthirius multifiliis TaxID=5932 RepID=G0QSR5_ICHMU|nr:hypothetical protein IMG5_102990 [Ichthyophthirius multifiliis]EGR31745.1 hypothetical protein IMG5_102990 [Ichthyophthirius multifiliis]|eukprot:XP_004035231.1 hypothetical protein IMG5_102990 [Ichthyophthirius multifiliis]